MVRFEGVTKRYGDKTALDQLDLDIRDGEIFGLIGHNGAGKSTTIKCLTSVIAPDAGRITVAGLDLADRRNDVKKMIGYVPDSPDMFLKSTAVTYWAFIAKIFDLPDAVRDRRIEDLCKLFELGDERYRAIEGFSHGMRQKVFVIGALLPEPAVWVLDEPLTGLDPQSAFNLKEMMRRHTAEGHTVLFSTHVLAVAEELCDRIGILRHGRLIFVGTMDELRAAHPGDSLETIYLRLVASADEGMAGV